MNEVNNQEKAAAIKTLAIIGFITAIVLCVWIAVQAVRFAPSGFATLANIAESVSGRSVPFSVTVDKTIVNAGEAFVITWTDMKKDGAYTFLYQCTEGVSAEIRNDQGDIVDANCESPVTLPFNESNATVIFSSEKDRFTDVSFSIGFTADGASEAAEEKTQAVTVVNATIPLIGEGTSTPEPLTPEVVEPEPVVPEPTPEPVQPPVTTPTPAVTPTPQPKPPVTTRPVPVVTTAIPVSNPNGFADLQTTFVGIGTYNDSTKVFTSTASLDNDSRGAVRFEVKNIGTKTSGTWTYEVTLPSGDNSSYSSPTQKALLPNERVLVTIAFGDVSNNTRTEMVKIEVDGGSDTNTKNNDVSQTVRIVD